MDFALTRYNSDGTLDHSFGNEEKISADFDEISNWAKSVALQSDGKIVVAGYSIPLYDFTIARFLSGLSVGVIEFLKNNNTLLVYPNPVQS